MMGLKFPISLTGKRGGGVDLTQDLFKWHEEYNALCSHTGTGGLNLAGIPSVTTNMPTGFTAGYAPNKDYGYVSANSRFAPSDFGYYTIATVIKKTGNGYGRKMWGGSSPINGQPANLSGDSLSEFTNYVQARGNTYRASNVGTTNNLWTSLVYVTNGTNMKVYKNGVLANERNDLDPLYEATSVWRMWDSQATQYLNWCMADRPWAQEDVDLFHNGGAFIKYADL